MGESLRLSRVSELLKEEIGVIINTELKNPHLGFVTVTGVEVSSDLKNAIVRVGILGSKKDKNSSVRILEQSKGFIQGIIGRRVRIKHTPALHFKLDESAEYSIKIAKILKKIKEEDKE